MTTPAKPLTADEIARIKRYVSGHRGLATPLAAEEGQSLIATIEQQAEQIEKLREVLSALVADVREYERVNNLAPNPGHKDCWQSVTNADGALAATEPKP